MPAELKPLFRADVLRARLRGFQLPDRVDALRGKLANWANLFEEGGGTSLKEQELLPGFLTDFFVELLGYTGPASGEDTYTFSREKLVEIDGKFADAAIGRFSTKADASDEFVIALEGKGPKDPLDRPYAGRKMSAVDQAYRYAINLRCDWIVVTSVRETRLYFKGADQFTCERFETARLATDEAHLRKFVFLLGSERVLPASGQCHLDLLREASEKSGRELTKKFYVRYAEMRQDAFDHLVRENPSVERPAVLSATQKLLDRVLFVAFCEDRGLLPDDSIKKAYEHRDPYHPRPVWQNFRGLFDAVNTGNDSLDIPAYNGGLFAPDDVLDQLVVPDGVCTSLHELGEYEYREPGFDLDEEEDDAALPVVDVDILGHIFEQSITDLERLRNELEGLVEPVGREKHRTRRKKEGAFYTPAFVTRYIVEQALGRTLDERFETLRAAHEAEASGTAVKSLADPRVYDLPALNNPQKEALVRFWEAWQDDLATVRLLDPACGSGAFLIEAFDQLHAAYEDSNERLHELRGHRSLFDVDRRILQENLYGVDLNAEAVEICRLSLWIKTAARGKELTSLDATIRVGNSVVDDPAVHPRALDWRETFLEVFERGGFDVVVGNPPYIRQEWIAPYKEFWSTRFRSHHGVADIFVYFFELAHELLKPGGRLGFITSGSWVRGNFGGPLRKLLAEESALETIIDFGEFQPFEGAEMIRPTILTFAKSDPAKNVRLFKWLVAGPPPEQLSEEIERSPTMSARHLGAGAWQLESDAVRILVEKLRSRGESVKERGLPIFRGIVTGKNDVFVIDGPTRDRLIAETPGCESIIKPFVQGTNLRPWYSEEPEQYLIFTRRGTEIDRFPSVLRYLEGHRRVLEPRPAGWKPSAGERTWPGRKPGSYKWFEIQDTVDYWSHFEQPKIVWPDISKLPRFSIENDAVYFGNTAFMVPSSDPFILGVLASWTSWFFISKTAQPLRLRGDRWQYRLFAQYLEKLPVPDASAEDRAAIGDLAGRCTSAATERYRLEQATRRRLDRTFRQSAGKLNQRASAWWEPSLKQLGAALKTSFKLDRNPFDNPRTADDWEPYLDEKRAEVQRLTTAIADAEAELNERVYRLFDLTPEEIALLEREVEH